MNKKLLSIIIPTYNRKDVLKYTLSLFHEQILRNIDFVEIVVCCNACTDNTLEFLNELKNERNYLQIVNYEDHAEIGVSIKRSAANAGGEYFILWSDDDLPGPMMIDQIVIKLKEYKGIGCLSFSRLNGFSYGINDIRNLFVFTPNFAEYDKFYTSSKEFVIDHYSEMDFLSINVILKDAWVKGLTVDTSTHYGFEFLTPILVGIQGYKCLYLEFPICIKRDVPLAENSYTYRWPYYAYIGIPHILQTLESNEIIEDWQELFSKYRYNISDEEFILNIFNFCYTHSEFYTPYIRELLEYQTDKFRKKVILNINSSNFRKRMIKYEFFIRRIYKRIIRRINIFI